MDTTHITVTSDTIDAAREAVTPLDMRAALTPGCEVWRAGGSWLLRTPDGRGAICTNGPSLWGDWDGDVLTLDDGSTRWGVDGSEVPA